MDFTEFLTEHVVSLNHLPFKLVVLVLWVFGHFFETSVFTEENAKKPGRMGQVLKWGRESLELHPIITGAALGVLWVDPENTGLGRVESIAYFAGAGVISLFVWWAVSVLSDRYGFRFSFPGERKKNEDDEA